MERQNSLLENVHEDALVKQELEERERENMWEQRLTKVRQSYESLLTEGSGRTNANLQPLLTEHFRELEELRTQKQQLELSNTTLSSQLRVPIKPTKMTELVCYAVFACCRASHHIDSSVLVLILEAKY